MNFSNAKNQCCKYVYLHIINNKNTVFEKYSSSSICYNKIMYIFPVIFLAQSCTTKVKLSEFSGAVSNGHWKPWWIMHAHYLSCIHNELKY